MTMPNISGQSSASSGASGQNSYESGAWNVNYSGVLTSGSPIPWYVWAGLAVLALVWLKKR